MVKQNNNNKTKAKTNWRKILAIHIAGSNFNKSRAPIGQYPRPMT